MTERLRDERGFTLIELLVASMVGMIVLFAAFGLVEATFKGQRIVESRIDGTERGRMAMEQVTRQLRAQVCLGKGIAPILEATDTKIVFYASVAPAPTNPSQVPTIQKRTLQYVPNGTTGRGSITETVIDGAGTLPAVTFNGTPRTRTITTEVAPPSNAPLFRYFKYDPNLSPTVQQLTLPINADNRQIIVQVQTAFVAYARDGRDSDRVKTRLENKITVRTADPTDPTRSPKCI
jgi:prepilin-type N-terminal cleavage/methylation domain-containing protein